MRVWLDDDLEYRPTPTGWTRATTARQAIEMLDAGEVEELSLDHDLGPEQAGTGYDVVLWLAEQSHGGRDLWPDAVDVHSANAVGAANMAAVIDRYSPLPRLGPSLVWGRPTTR